MSDLPVNLPEYSRLPPQSIDHERSLLGTMLNVENFAYRIVDRLHPDLFRDITHREVFESIQAAVEKGGPVHLLTVMPFYRQITGKDEQESRQDLLRIIQRDYSGLGDVPAAGEAEHLFLADSIIETLIERWQRRELMRLSGIVGQCAHAEDIEVSETLGQLAEETDRIAAGSRQGKRTADHLEKLFQEGKARYEAGNDLLGPAVFGIAKTDKMLDGAHPEGVIVIAGWTGSGKSAVFNTIIKNCTRLNQPCYSWSGELSETRQLHRNLAAETGINSRVIARGGYYDAEKYPDGFTRIDAAAQRIAAVGHVFESGPMTLGRILTTISYHYRVKGVRVFLFDRKELFSVDTRHGNSDEAIGNILSRMRALVSELGGGCVFVASQVRKSHESNPGSRPTLADVIGSGAVTAAATAVMITHRPEYYDILEDEHGNSLKGVAFLDIVKNSFGEIGETRVRFLAAVSEFVEEDAEPNPFTPTPAPALPPAKPYGGAADMPQGDTDEDIPF